MRHAIQTSNMIRKIHIETFGIMFDSTNIFHSRIIYSVCFWSDDYFSITVPVLESFCLVSMVLSFEKFYIEG